MTSNQFKSQARKAKLTILVQPPSLDQGWVRDRQATIFAAAQGLTPSQLIEPLIDLCMEINDESPDMESARNSLERFATQLDSILYIQRLVNDYRDELHAHLPVLDYQI